MREFRGLSVMTILERMKELVGTCDRRVTFDLEGPNCRCGDIEQMGKCWCGCYENVLEHAERIRAENAWLRDTLPILLEAVEALDSLVMACKLPGDHCDVEQALLSAEQALAKLEAPDA